VIWADSLPAGSSVVWGSSDRLSILGER
jgi:hypothetical protein